jgi:hypothetical protein
MLLHSVANTVDDVTAVVPARFAEVGGTMTENVKGAQGHAAPVSSTDALMGGLISVLSGTLVILWLRNASSLRTACGIVLGCYFVCVVAVTQLTRHQRSARPTERD